MLKVFRKKAVSRIILWGLLILILPAFVMWGSASMSRSKEKGPAYVGFINNKKVSFDELYGAISGVRTQIILNYFNQPAVLDALLGNKPLLAKLAWDRILMLNEAKKMKITVADKEVVAFLETHPLFLRNGKFDDRFYSYMLRNNIGLEPRAFEEAVRENITIQKLGAVITKDMKITDEELADEYKKEFSKIKLSYLLVPLKDFLDKVKVDENAVKDFYDKHKNEMMMKSPLQGAIPDRMATLEEAKATIENRLKEIEARKLAAENSEDIYKKINGRMESGKESFDKAASKLSFTIKSTAFLSRTDNAEDIGNMAPVFDASSQLKDSEVSKPLEVKDGFILFQIAERQAVDEEQFKKEKEDYSKKIHERKSNISMEGWLRGLESKAPLAIKLDEIEKYLR